jgi:hypothetical protein
VLGGAGTGILTSGSGNTVTITNEVAQPNAYVFLQDDFIGASTDQTVSLLLSDLTWRQQFKWNQSTTLPTSGNPGIIGSPGSSAGFDTPILLGSNNSNGNTGPIPQIILGGGVLTINWVVKVAILSTATPRYIFRCGLGGTENADQVNGLYFEYSDNINSGNWAYKSAKSSSRTTSNSSVTVTNTIFHNLQITVNANASSVAFSVDGVSLGAPITTNIPTLAVTPFISIMDTVGNILDNCILVDLFYLSQILTTPR